MIRKATVYLSLVVLSAFCAVPASAGVIDSADVNGLRTFQDTVTGRVWVDLDNYFGLSYLDLKADVESKGFIVATRTDVDQLLGSLPLGGGQWPSYEAIMGGAPNRGLIWGAYVPEGATQSWAYAFDYSSSWEYQAESGFALGEIPNEGGDFADLNIWAYQGGEVVIPEPSTVSMFAGAGLLLLMARRRKS